MPRPTLPPTPGSSSDIKAKDGPQLGFSQMAFELPPPAIAGMDSRPSSASAKSSSASSYHPTSPKSPAMTAEDAPSSTRRRSSTANTSAKDSFALPPPPTRSRKIIQMKPRAQEEIQEGAAAKGGAAAKSATAAGKKKTPSATSVAGRKIARKTAHSLIERRRRSKMNEEFGVLKDMIPACTGEMHKLAILQASIDYVRYLQDCVTRLQAQNASTPTVGPTFTTPFTTRSYSPSSASSDVEMGNSPHASPTYTQPQTAPTPSPALLAQDPYCTEHRDQRHYSYSQAGSSTTSPAFGPQLYEYAGSALTSPALGPRESEMDQEATQALLMLNTDRRNTSSGSGRSMSVKDLLSA